MDEAVPSEELIAVVDTDGRHLGVQSRHVVHRDGLWHEVFHCLVVRTDLPARVVLQRRGRNARSFPWMLDLSVTGHLRAGEGPLDGVREIEEEIGLVVERSRLVPIGRRLIMDDAGGEGRNREIAHVYLLPDDTPLEAFPLDPSEVGGLVEITTAGLVTMLRDPAAASAATSVEPGGRAVRVACTAAELVPDDGYWWFVAAAAERYVSVSDRAG